MKGRKRKNGLIEDDIVRYIDAPSGDIQALETFMHIAIAKEYTAGGTKLEFVSIV
jgi:hypothetical protein